MANLVQKNELTDGKDVTVRVNGKLFRCSCGCNVFQHPLKRPNVYKCNSCGVGYEEESEEDQAFIRHVYPDVQQQAGGV